MSRSLAVGLALAATWACHGTDVAKEQPIVSSSQPPNDQSPPPASQHDASMGTDGNTTTVPDAAATLGCVDALRALAAGRVADWHGLGPDCTRAAAEEALGPSAPGPDGSGNLGGSPTVFRTYTVPPAEAVVVWFVEDRIVFVRVVRPVIAAETLTAALGAPEAEAPSKLKARHTQWIYASRGLVAHVKNVHHEVFHLYGFAPTTTDEFLRSWMSEVEIIRRPVR